MVIGSNGTQLLFPNYKLLRENNIKTRFIVDATTDDFAQHRAIMKRYLRRGLDYEDQLWISGLLPDEYTFDTPYDTRYDAEEAGGGILGDEQPVDDTNNNAPQGGVRTPIPEGECAAGDASCEAGKGQNPGTRQEQRAMHDVVPRPGGSGATRPRAVIDEKREFEVKFFNLSPNTIKLVWVKDPQGSFEDPGNDAKILTSIKPGKFVTLKTFLGHHFLAADTEDFKAIVGHAPLAVVTVTHNNLREKEIVFLGVEKGWVSRHPALPF